MILTAQDFFGLKPPCKGCQKRGPYCHVEGNCKEYDEYRSLIEEYKESEKYKRYMEEDIWRSANV